ncbi:MAG: hypothetical protein E6H00_01910 [Bacillati bacterium ANGP1]|uniref:Uncharacterized protein n=1 Tax=Candidatus Segetimicrobium genomatis TaxID=2569760 RepID=A0A537KB47_9BACT|nr:MAG: hypothetical protein E6H00_01910 [Terrabacteria group bacterium ANGP1]
MAPARDQMGFELPPRSVFEPPSYPNIWFYVRDTLVPSHAGAVELVTGWLRDRCGLVNDFTGFKPPEASDAQARLRGLQPWPDAPDAARSHAHDLHIRYYYVALRQTRCERAASPAGAGQGDYFRLAGSVHYEVEDEHPLHPYDDGCPYCGRTGTYAGADDLFAGVHEPLGLELLCRGTIRGERVTLADGRPMTPLTALGERYAVVIHRLRPSRPDMNIVDLAVVLIGPKRGAP